MSVPAQQQYLSTHLKSILPDDTRQSLRDSLIPTLLSSLNDIAAGLRSASEVALVGSANAFGDDQLNVDVLAENIIRCALKKCPEVYAASSEEDPVEKRIEHESPSENGNGNGNGNGEEPGVERERYTVAFDPLDGSSIIAPNWTVGTILGIWDSATALDQLPSTKLIASIIGVFGPRTTAIVAFNIPGGNKTCFEVAIEEGRSADLLVVTRSQMQLDKPPFKTRYFAPANLRAAAEEPAYFNLVSHFIKEKYTLRYSGGLVPDVVHALVKGHGVYVSPVTDKSKAKLRVLFELTPIALVVECAGGLAINSEDGKRILEAPIRDIDERGGLVCGTAEDVEYAMKMLMSA